MCGERRTRERRRRCGRSGVHPDRHADLGEAVDRLGLPGTDAPFETRPVEASTTPPFASNRQEWKPLSFAGSKPTQCEMYVLYGASYVSSAFLVYTPKQPVCVDS